MTTSAQHTERPGQLRGPAAETALTTGRATTHLGTTAKTPPMSAGGTTTPAPQDPTPVAPAGPRPVLPPRPPGKPDPAGALTKVERLGTEVPGMLRSLDAEVQTAIRLDFEEFSKVRALRDAKNGFPVDKVDSLGTQLEELRKHVQASAKGVSEAWQRIYAPYVDRPRTLHAMADQLDAVRRRVADLDESYERLAKPQQAWTGSDAEAYRARVEPQRVAAGEFAGLCGLLSAKVLHLAMLHATVYVVVHQAVQGLIRELKAANGTKGGGGDLGVRMSLASSRLDHLADWLETYSQRADWIDQVQAAGSAMSRLVADTSYFPRGKWPEGTLTTVAPVNATSSVEVQKAADARAEQQRKAAEEAYAKAEADLERWEAVQAAAPPQPAPTQPGPAPRASR